MITTVVEGGGEVRVALFTRWNATCGVAMHAEMLVNEMLKRGEEVIIFAPYLDSANKWWHHRIVRKDEDFVVRCYREMEPSTMSGGGIDLDKIMKEDFDVLLVESYTSIPYKDVERLVGMLREGGITTGVVVHEGDKESMKYSSLDIFDFVAVFDDRYVEMLRGYGGNIHVIPYPCYPVNPGNREFGEDGIKLFSFGRQPEKEYADFIEALDRLSNKYDFIYRIVRSDGLLNLSRKWLIQERERIKDTEEVYGYLHSSDIHLLPKGRTDKVVVSSTLCQCIGSLVPTVAPNTRHFETLPEDNPVLLYRDVDDLVNKLSLLIEDKNTREKLRENARKYVEENRMDVITDKFLKLFETVKEKVVA